MRSLVLEQAELALGRRQLAPARATAARERRSTSRPTARDSRRSSANVLSNAVKYSPTGGTITVGADAERRGRARIWSTTREPASRRAPRADLPAVLPRRGAAAGIRHRARARGLAPDRRGSRRDDRLRLARRRHAVLDRAARRANSRRAGPGRAARHFVRAQAPIRPSRVYGRQTPAHDAGRRGRGLLESSPLRGAAPSSVSARREARLQAAARYAGLSMAWPTMLRSPEGRGDRRVRRPARPPAPRGRSNAASAPREIHATCAATADGGLRASTGCSMRCRSRRSSSESTSGTGRPLRAGPPRRPSPPLRLRGVRKGRAVLDPEPRAGARGRRGAKRLLDRRPRGGRRGACADCRG